MLTALLALTSAAPGAGTEAVKKCVVCDTTISGNYFNVTSPALAERQVVCEACKALPTRCAICVLPVRDRFRKLDDGRLMCDRDFRAGVFETREALRIYEEAKRDAKGILHGFGELPDRNITVTLVNRRQLLALNQSLPTAHEDSALLGLTRTTVDSRKQYEHSISLLSGLNPAELAAVCVHEYTHAWLNENLPDDRKLEKDTIEGFCELVAYKVMTRRNEDQQKRVILANAYTRGQVNAFVQAENAMQFHRVVQWIKTGVDETLPENNSNRVLAVNDNSPPPFVWPPPAPRKTAVPSQLTLKGISGAATRRFALINDTTLMKDEERRVRVGASNVVVRCLDIKSQSVVIQVRGSAGPTELFLSAARN